MPYHTTKQKMNRVSKNTKKPKPIKPPPSKPIPIPSKPKPKPNTLTKKQEEQLKNASKNHTKKHIDYMRKLMKEGNTFTQAHNKALKDVGK